MNNHSFTRMDLIKAMSFIPFPSNELEKIFNSEIPFFDFSGYTENERIQEMFFIDYENYIKSFADYFDNDYDYVVLHLELCGFNIWPDDMSMEKKSQYIIDQYNK